MRHDPFNSQRNLDAPRGVVFGIISSCALAAALAGSVDAAVIQLRSQSEVIESIVRLGDVADISDAEPQLLEQLKAVRLSPAPAPGRTGRLDLATIQSRLLAEGFDLSRAQFSGSSVVSVSRGETRDWQPVGPAEPARVFQASRAERQQAERLVTQAVEDYLLRAAPDLGEFDVTVELEAHDVPVILSAVDGRIEAGGGAPPWNGPLSLAVRLLDADGRLREVQVRCQVDRHPQVVTVKHMVPAGAVLRPEDLAFLQVESPTDGVTRPDDLIGKQARRSLRPGKPIQEHEVQAVPLVKSGDTVTVISRRGGITAKRQMRSRSTAALGETVTLVSIAGRQTLLATVTGYREAEVLGSGSPPPGEGAIQFQSADRINKTDSRMEADVYSGSPALLSAGAESQRPSGGAWQPKTVSESLSRRRSFPTP